MESLAPKQVKYGRSCTRCRSYFVSFSQSDNLCPWCTKVEAGAADETSYDEDGLLSN
jgi:hypothetical protein